jgi:hypothetical protein
MSVGDLVVCVRAGYIYAERRRDCVNEPKLQGPAVTLGKSQLPTSAKLLLRRVTLSGSEERSPSGPTSRMAAERRGNSTCRLPQFSVLSLRV